MGAGPSPSEVASRVYTWDATSDIKVTSRDPGGSPCLLFRPACTHGTRFPTAVGREGPLRQIPRPARTRGADFLTSGQPPGGGKPPPRRNSPIACTHGTRFLTRGTSRHPDARTHDDHGGESVGSEWGGPLAFRASLSLHARRVTVAPFPEPLPAGEGRRGGSGASRRVPAGSELPMRALPLTLAVTGARPRRASPVGSSSALQRWQ